jgi:redox-sensitive bicupin YhaK (pirin superfamily)
MRQGRLKLLASRDGRQGSLTVHQDVALYGGLFDAGEHDELELAPGRSAWVQVARGTVRLNGETLRAGDGAALSGERRLTLEGLQQGEVLVFDLA